MPSSSVSDHVATVLLGIVDSELHPLQDRVADAESDGESLAAEIRDSALPFAERRAKLAAFRYAGPELIDRMFTSPVFTARSRNAPIGADADAAHEEVEDALIEAVVTGASERAASAAATFPSAEALTAERSPALGHSSTVTPVTSKRAPPAALSVTATDQPWASTTWSTIRRPNPLPSSAVE